MFQYPCNVVSGTRLHHVVFVGILDGVVLFYGRPWLCFVRQATEAMVTSVVLNDDVVPRMSAQSIELLADQVRRDW